MSDLPTDATFIIPGRTIRALYVDGRGPGALKRKGFTETLCHQCHSPGWIGPRGRKDQAEGWRVICFTCAGYGNR